ncbi:MAG: hypothetical protein WCP31_03830 [Chloroflexales bacterium]
MAYTLALRPNAPALTRPQRMLLKIEGEQIVALEYRPDVGPGSPFAQAARMGFEQLVTAATLTCPTCGTAHALALCQAVETLAAITVPPRAAVLRVIAAELERATSHLAAVATIFAALALPTIAEAFTNESATTRKALSDLQGGTRGAWLVPGGVAGDLSDEPQALIVQIIAASLDNLFTLADKSLAQRYLLARTVEVGVITASAATQFNLGGPMARAAGLKADMRLDAPYAAYAAFPPKLVTQEGGDVYARLTQLVLEALESLKLAERAIRELPAGLIRGALPATLPTGSSEGAAEAPRGPLHYKVETDGGRLGAVYCRPAPQLDRLLAQTALIQATVDNAALIFVSTDPCDTCLGMAHDG